MDANGKAAGANGGFLDCSVQRSSEQGDHTTVGDPSNSFQGRSVPGDEMPAGRSPVATPDFPGSARARRKTSGAAGYDGADVFDVMPAPRSRRNAIGGTSQAAARSLKLVSSEMCRAIMQILEDGPKSPEEVVDALRAQGIHLGLNTARARMSDLRRAGRVRDSGLRSLSASGCKVVAWEITPTGADIRTSKRYAVAIDPAVAVGFADRLPDGEQVRFLKAALVSKLEDLMSQWPDLLGASASPAGQIW